MTRLPIAPNGVFDTIQGEGLLIGLPMTFVRLGGCSVGCPECDTDYSVAERLSVAEIVERIQRLPQREWVWLTGGEPTDHAIGRLVEGLRADGHRVALATAGVRLAAKDGWAVHATDFLSVSPHFAPASGRLVVQSGDQLNVVHGLNGVRAGDFASVNVGFWRAAWVTPLSGDGEAVSECVRFASEHAGWRVGIQAHKQWGVA